MDLMMVDGKCIGVTALDMETGTLHRVFSRNTILGKFSIRWTIRKRKLTVDRSNWRIRPSVLFVHIGTYKHG